MDDNEKRNMGWEMELLDILKAKKTRVQAVGRTPPKRSKFSSYRFSQIIFSVNGITLEEPLVSTSLSINTNFEYCTACDSALALG